jgi:hypothetical protein
MCRVRRLLMMGARVPEICRAEYKYNKVLIILRLLCIWLVFYSLLPPSSVETKNKGRFTCTLSCAFIACTRALPIIFILCNDTFTPSNYPSLNELWLYETTNIEA